MLVFWFCYEGEALTRQHLGWVPGGTLEGERWVPSFTTRKAREGINSRITLVEMVKDKTWF